MTMKHIIMLGMVLVAILVSLYGCSGASRQGISYDAFYNDNHSYGDDGDLGIMRGDNF
jgi:hypothetical protein